MPLSQFCNNRKERPSSCTKRNRGWNEEGGRSAERGDQRLRRRRRADLGAVDEEEEGEAAKLSGFWRL